MHPVLSNDSQTVLFLSNADLIGANPDHRIQAFIIEVDGSGLAQLTSEPHGVTEAALSGDATIAYVETDTGRILRIGTADGSVIELIGRTPAFGGPSGGAVPGSQNHLYGSGLAEREASAQSPLPASLGGTQLLIDGQPAPLSFASPTEIRFQIPWEQTANPGVPVMVTVNSDASPFEAPPATVYLSRFSPWFEYPDARLVQPSMRFAEIFHSDGSQVLPSNPAAPGEVLHFSMSGLGTVTPALPTGQSGTAALTNAFECRLGVNSSPVEVISAGMTPDAVGLYQVVIRVSAEVTNGGVLSCGDFVSPGLYGSGSIFLPIAGR